MSLLDRVRARITFWNVLRVVGAVGFAAAVIWPPPTSAHVPHNPPAADIVVVQLHGAGRAPDSWSCGSAAPWSASSRSSAGFSAVGADTRS